MREKITQKDNADKPLQDIQKQYGKTGFFPQSTQSIRRPHITGANAADIDTFKELNKKISGRYRAD
jgi:hypothetical protein